MYYFSGKFFMWIVVCAFLTLSSCSLDKNPKWRLYDIEGHLPDLKFSLQSSGGEDFSEKKFLGKIVLLFFGYANCPDICPTTISQINTVLNTLGEKSINICTLFVSIDPHRDDSETLQAYLNSFGSNIIGLTGSSSKIETIARRYRIAYQIEKPKQVFEKLDPDQYEVIHSRGIYIFDRKGKARLLASNTDNPDDLVKDLLCLIEE